MGEEWAVPPGTHLLHIGPQKTGSTALQSALHRARDQLASYDVVYPGPGQKPTRAIAAGLGLGLGRGATPPRRAAWLDLLAQIDRGDEQRVVISYEKFGRLTGDEVKQVVAELGGRRPHIVTGARRYDRLLPSQWQQRIKAGKRWPYDEWLRAVLIDGPPDSADPHGFWVPHDTVRMVERWAEVVGPDRLTLVVRREGDPRHLVAAFEALLALPSGLLQPVEDQSNRSLSHQEVELVRSVNIALTGIDHDDHDWHTLFSRGLLPTLVDRPFPVGEDPLPPLPVWARERVDELGEARIDGLRRLGVQMIGDLDSLRTRLVDDEPPAEVTPSPTTVSLETATKAIEGVLLGARRRRLHREGLARDPSPPR